MDIFETQMLNMVFERTDNWKFPEITIDGRMILVLARVDGITTLGRIKQDLYMDMDDLKDAVNKLATLNLIHPGNRLSTSAPLDTQNASREEFGRAKAMVYRGVSYGN